MTPEEMRIAIAEYCGWTRVASPQYGHGPHQGFKPGGSTVYTMPIPDYCNDLNAIHEAEKRLSNEHLDKYEKFLVQIQLREQRKWILGEKREIYAAEYRTIHATALQRAEAFLRTVWKWRGA